ncbi:hypothetical protein [Rhodococcus sp. NPDC059234]|uniref:hypothetical protein n=1 Tax=Rhodococcus sp. NPDC059234 TaxID=3346781 RepID=UPI003672394A
MNNSRRRTARHRAVATRAILGIAASGALVLTAAPASAAPATTPVPGGAVCDPKAEACLAVVVNSGNFDNNGFTLPMKDGDMIIAGTLPEQGDIIPRDDGHNGVYGRPMTVPGGVLGFDLPLNNLFGLAGVTSEVQAVSVPHFNTDNITDFDMSLPVRLKINNTFLGDNCYIGSPETPVVFNLKPANTPADPPGSTIGAPYPEGTVSMTNVKNEATGFALPGATGCGPFGALNPIVNWRAKVPNSTGTSLNTVSTGYLFPAAAGGTDPLTGAGTGGSSGSSGGSSGS